MTKKEKLEALDTLVLDRMLNIMKDKDPNAIRALSDLSTPMNYLKNNQMIADKPKSTVEQDTKERIRQANERRKARKDT